MGVLEGFMTTWTKAYDQYGEGAPPSGAHFDQSSQLRSLQGQVESAAPGSRWTGGAATAYGKVNSDHAKVFGGLADLDQRLGSKVDHAGDIVTTGRQNLNALKQWVTDAAAAVPPGKNRDQLLLPIVSNGLGQLQDIVKDSNGKLNGVANDIKMLSGEYDKLGKQKFAPKEGPDFQKIKDEEKKEPKPEDMEELVKRALNGGGGDAASQVKGILGSISPDQLGPNAKANPLSPLQAELVGQMQAQMKLMSLKDLDATRQSLGDNKGILGDAMQVMSDPDVTFPRHDKDGPQVVAATPGYPLPNYGVLPGDRGALPDSVQHVLNTSGKFGGPENAFDPRFGPPTLPGIVLEDRAMSAKEDLMSLANIVGDGDSRFQQGSELDRGMMNSAKEFLHFQTGSDAQGHWADDVTQRVFETAGRDTVVDHDMFRSDKEFTHDVLTHDWKDDGKAASTLTAWIENSAESQDPIVNARAGETANALAGYLGDPANKNDLMNINTGTQQDVSMGKLNPELARSLAHAMSPYIDEMAGRNMDSTSGWKSIDGGDLSSRNAANVFGVLGTDGEAAKTLDVRSFAVQQAYIDMFADSVISSHGQSAESTAMDQAGRLKGITDMGAFISESDVGHDANAAKHQAYERLGRNYDIFKDVVSAIPVVGDGSNIAASVLKEAIVGEPPPNQEPGNPPKGNSLAMQSALASVFMQHGIGDPADIEKLRPYLNVDATLDIPPEEPYKGYPSYVSSVKNYFDRMDAVVSRPIRDDYDKAYRDVVE